MLKKKKILFILFLIFLIFSVLILIKAEKDTKTIVVNRIDLKYDNLNDELKDYKIGFISDIHLGPSTHKNFLENIVKKLNKENLDILLLGGDYIWYDESRYMMLKRNDEFDKKSDKSSIKTIYKKIAHEISKVKTKDGIYMIMGNHDNWIYPVLLKREIKKYKNLKLFTQEIYNIKKKDLTISLYAFDDFWNKSPFVKKEDVKIKENEFRIVFSHNPDAIYYLTKYFSLPFHLSLSGHTHGGQIRLPFFPICTNTFFKKFKFGLKKKHLGYHYTSTGLGCTSVPFRFNVRPEIVVFNLKNNI